MSNRPGTVLGRNAENSYCVTCLFLSNEAKWGPVCSRRFFSANPLLRADTEKAFHAFSEAFHVSFIALSSASMLAYANSK